MNKMSFSFFLFVCERTYENTFSTCHIGKSKMNIQEMAVYYWLLSIFIRIFENTSKFEVQMFDEKTIKFRVFL